MTPTVLAGECSAIFPTGIGGNSNSSDIYFGQNSVIYNNPDVVVVAKNIDADSSGNSCYLQDCTASGTTTDTMSFNPYQSTNSKTTLTIGQNSAGTIGTSTNEYKKVQVDIGASLSVSSNYDYYEIKEMVLGQNSIATFAPGDYWIEKFKMEIGSQVVISGEGTARFYFKDDAVIGQNAQFNVAHDANYQPGKVMIYGKKDIKLEVDSHVVGFIYTKEDMTFGQRSITRGSISVRDGTLEQDAQIYYMGDELSQTDFDGACVAASLDHYQIIHDGSGSSCEGESVEIKACSNADCSSLYTGTVSLDLQGNGSTLISSDDFSGSTTLWFAYGVDETLSLSVANQSETGDNATVCSDGSSDSCNMVFSPDSCPLADSCAAVFRDGLNNSDSDGKIKFEDQASISDNFDIYLATELVQHKDSEVLTCVDDNCRALNILASTMNGSYFGYSSDSNFEANGETKTIDASDYKDVKAKNSGVLNMNSAISSYTFKKLKVESGSTLNLVPGDYYVEELEIKGTSTVNVIGDGTARIWASGKAKFRETSTVNAGASGNPAKLFVYFHADDDEKMKIEGGASVAAYLYSANKIEIKDASKFYGAATAEGELKVKDSAEVVRKTSTLDDGDFGAACGSSVSVLDHYRYEYDGSALTCATESVVIKACANADCSEFYEQTSNIGFAVTADGTTVNTELSFTGSVSVDVAESSQQTLVMSLNAASPSGNLYCYQNGELDDECNYDVEDTGFIFINTDTGSDEIATQISGKGSNEGANPINLALQAVQTDTTTGACVPLFSDATGVDILLSHQCVDPGACVVNNGDQNQLKLTNNGDTHALSHYPSYAEHTLFFDGESKASFSINYPDAGKIKLHAQMSIVLSDDETTVITGNSKEFVVRPFALSLVAEDYVAAIDNSGPAYKMAGEAFGLTVKAHQWQAADDCDLDGFADVDALCGGSRHSAVLTDNGVTLNFGQEAIPEGATASSVRISPIFGDDPGLDGGRFNSFSAGVDSVDVNWNNVGIIDIAVALNDDGLYLETEALTVTLEDVGRFVPSHFKLNSASVTQGCGDFSYMGQDLTVALEIEALGVGDISLSNYDSSVEADPLSDKGYHGFAAIGLVAENGNDGVDLGGRFESISYRWVDGVLSGSYLLDFARVSVDDVPSVDGPYEQMDIGVMLDDGDSITINFASDDLNMNALTTGDCSGSDNCTAALLNPSAASFKFGRLISAQAYGPQTENLTLPLLVQYWDGNRFATVETDNCSTLQVEELTISGETSTPLESDYDVYDPNDNDDIGDSSVVTSTLTTDTTLSAQNGIFDLTFSAPNVVGYVPVLIDVSAYPWLQYDWSSNGTGEVEAQLPQQSVSFGQFRGNDKVIYWREKR